MWVFGRSFMKNDILKRNLKFFLFSSSEIFLGGSSLQKEFIDIIFIEESQWLA